MVGGKEAWRGQRPAKAKHRATGSEARRGRSLEVERSTVVRRD
jgi:hypothetical protein